MVNIDRVPSVCSSYPKEIKKYVTELFLKRNDADVVNQRIVEDGEWKPELNECHNNVDDWCKLHSDYQPVRGWLFYALDYEAGFVMFLAHSVVLTPEETLLDITPSKVADSYPFIIANESGDDFFAKARYLIGGNLFFCIK